MPIVAALPGLLADGETVTLVALTTLLALEILLRRTGFAGPETVNLDLDDPLTRRR